SWAVGSWFALWWPATVVFLALLAALVGVNMFLLAYELTGKTWIAWAVWLPLAFSNPVLSYALLLFTELPTALLVLYAFRRLAPASLVPEAPVAAPSRAPCEGSAELTHLPGTRCARRFGRQMGLLPCAAIALLAGVGIIAMCRSARAAARPLAGWLAVIALP